MTIPITFRNVFLEKFLAEKPDLDLRQNALFCRFINRSLSK